MLVTGAGRGIGRAIALVLAEAGADVAITGLTEANAASVAREVRALGRQGLGLAADATSLADTEDLAERVLGAFGHLDVLINCVGDSIPGHRCPDARYRSQDHERV